MLLITTVLIRTFRLSAETSCELNTILNSVNPSLDSNVSFLIEVNVETMLWIIILVHDETNFIISELQ